MMNLVEQHDRNQTSNSWGKIELGRREFLIASAAVAGGSLLSGCAGIDIQRFEVKPRIVCAGSSFNVTWEADKSLSVNIHAGPCVEAVGDAAPEVRTEIERRVTGQAADGPPLLENSGESGDLIFVPASTVCATGVYNGNVVAGAQVDVLEPGDTVVKSIEMYGKCGDEARTFQPPTFDSTFAIDFPLGDGVVLAGVTYRSGGATSLSLIPPGRPQAGIPVGAAGPSGFDPNGVWNVTPVFPPDFCPVTAGPTAGAPRRTLAPLVIDLLFQCG